MPNKLRKLTEVEQAYDTLQNCLEVLTNNGWVHRIISFGGGGEIYVISPTSKKEVEEIIDTVLKSPFSKAEYLYQKSLGRLIHPNQHPKWAKKEVMLMIYEGLPLGHHTDHIVPLRHHLVCGLHCPANLRYLPKEENMAKGNFFRPYRRVKGKKKAYLKVK